MEKINQEEITERSLMIEGLKQSAQEAMDALNRGICPRCGQPTMGSACDTCS